MEEKKKIYLCLAHMSDNGEELKYIKEAFDTNWVVPLGPNVDAFEKELENYSLTPNPSPKGEGRRIKELNFQIENLTPRTTII